MPRICSFVTAVVCLAFVPASCTPSQFVWSDPALHDVEEYHAAFRSAAGDRLVRKLSRQDLLRLLGRESLLWLGDHHRSMRLHTLQLELLEQLQASGVRMTLMLEAIGTQDQATVHDYLGNKLSMDELCARLRRRWSGSWLDDAELDSSFYRRLLAFARRCDVPVCALEPTPRLPLARRDAAMAAAVRARAARATAESLTSGSSLIVVIVGQTHLAGAGDLPGRTGLPGVCIGGEPVPALRAVAPTPVEPETLWLSDKGLWWFAELFAAGS